MARPLSGMPCGPLPPEQRLAVPLERKVLVGAVSDGAGKGHRNEADAVGPGDDAQMILARTARPRPGPAKQGEGKTQHFCRTGRGSASAECRLVER